MAELGEWSVLAFKRNLPALGALPLTPPTPKLARKLDRTLCFGLKSISELSLAASKLSHIRSSAASSPSTPKHTMLDYLTGQPASQCVSSPVQGSNPC